MKRIWDNTEDDIRDELKWQMSDVSKGQDVGYQMSDVSKGQRTFR